MQITIKVHRVNVSNVNKGHIISAIQLKKQFTNNSQLTYSHLKYNSLEAIKPTNKAILIREKQQLNTRQSAKVPVNLIIIIFSSATLLI